MPSTSRDNTIKLDSAPPELQSSFRKAAEAFKSFPSIRVLIMRAESSGWQEAPSRTPKMPMYVSVLGEIKNDTPRGCMAGQNGPNVQRLVDAWNSLIEERTAGTIYAYFYEGDGKVGFETTF
jgi:hypothetical protein